jgi:hypothetical protein
MLEIAHELAAHDSTYDELAELRDRVPLIARAMNRPA